MSDLREHECYRVFADEVSESFDEIERGSLIAITWSPDPNRYPFTDPRREYKFCLDYILLCSYKFFRKFVFFPEINAAGHVHIHGYFILKDKIKYFREFLPRLRLIGFVLTKTKVDTGWFEYCCKEVAQTVSVCGSDLPIPLTDLNCAAYRTTWKKARIAKAIPRLNILKYFIK